MSRFQVFSRPRLPWAAMLLAIATSIWTPNAQGSVFYNFQRWPLSAAGWVVIPVCVDTASSTLQKGDSAGGIIHDPNPSLDEVLRHVRRALANSWERHSAVRFVGWQPCNLPSDGVVQLYIHPKAGNNSLVGFGSAGKQDGVNFQPWGASFNRCITYNPNTTHMQYSFDCVEQYAIHEFGHVLGFEHEWEYHPSTPQACIQNRIDANAKDWTVTDLWHPIDGSYSAVFDTHKLYTIASSTYDYDSIMTYHEPDCSHKTGVRFGGTNLSGLDILGALRVYPPVVTGSWDVGVLPDTGGCSGDTEPITVYTDSEDDGTTTNLIGWSGATQVGHNLQFEFCRADGTRFGKVSAPPGSRIADYAVLRLGIACPPGSREFVRYMDNEDSNNQNYMTGSPYPNRQNFSGGSNTELHFCLFQPENTGGFFMSNFPLLSMSYGVFAYSDHPLTRTAGIIHSDDEDSNNQNSWTYADPSMAAAVSRIVNGTTNTNFNLIRVLDAIYALNTGVSPLGTGVVSPISGQVYPQNATVELLATPSPGYVFSSWTGPVFSPYSAGTSILMTSAATVIANFVTSPASILSAVSGSNQTAVIRGAYSLPLQAGAYNRYGQAMPGEQIDFRIVGSSAGAGGTFANGQQRATAITDSNGIATTPAVIANGIPGTFTVIADPNSFSMNANFTLTNQIPAGTPAILATPTAKTGAVPGIRQWDFSVRNSSGPAFDVALASITLTQSGGPACTTPTVQTSLFPLSVGSLATAGSSLTVRVPIDFGNCQPTARFTVDVGISANAGTYVTSTRIGNQFP